MSSFTILPVPVERKVHAPYATLAAMQVADVAVTGFILAHWTKRAEGNPIASYALSGGLVIGLVLLLVVKLAMVAVFYDTQFPVKLAQTVYALVLANNALFLGLWAWRVWA